ncbi:MAG TPA: FtsX-like permease family protein [Acidimicrobiales bacterium]|jgi:hypothetical protein
MASVAAARRTQSSFSTFLASTNPSQLTLAIFPSGAGGYSPALTRAIGHVRGVKRVQAWTEGYAVPLGGGGKPRLSTLSDLTVVGSVDGLSFDIDRPAVLQGRMADPGRADEFVTTPDGARLAGWHVGQVVPFGAYTLPQAESAGFSEGHVKPKVLIEDKLVGLVKFSDDVVEDQVDRYPTFALLTPAFAADLVRTGASFASYYGVQTTQGNANVTRVEQALARILPSDLEYQIHVTSEAAARTDQAIKPTSIALGVFGLIAALVALVLGGQAVGRQLRRGQSELEVLRAMGAGPATTLGDALSSVAVAVLLGALLAGGVAVALSPVGPVGPVRSVYPYRGFAADWTVLGVGVAALLFVLGGLAVALALRSAPHRAPARMERSRRSRPVLGNVAAEAGLPPAALAGIRFAFEPGDTLRATPVRSALFGTALAVTVVVTTLTFGSGLSTLVSRPALYGWNWSYALFSETGPDVPPQTVPLLRHDRDVAAFSEASTADPQIDGRSVPAIFEPAGSAVVPPILSGHAPEADDQIVLGAATLAQLHAHVGGTVTAGYGTPKDAPLYIAPTVLHVVGTATFPALGFPSAEGDHTSMGTGALLPNGVVPASFRAAMASPDPTLDGPEFELVRMRSGLSPAVARADMGRIARAGDRAFAAAPGGDGTGDTVLVFSDLLPAQIVNYQSMGAIPVLLAGSLAAAAVVALGLTLVASVRRRERELALFKTLGFTGRQISTAIAVQSTSFGIVGALVGIPLGIVAGRWLWVLFARGIYAVPVPTVPVVAVIAVGAAALVLANLAALWPGRAAARTATASLLRAD